jgi:predicted secreted protein
MTTEERRIANAGLAAGPWANHDLIVIAVAKGLGLEPTDVEAVLIRLRIGEVLNCVHYMNDSVCYEEGKNWRVEKVRIRSRW